MERRNFLKLASVGTATAIGAEIILRRSGPVVIETADQEMSFEDMSPAPGEMSAAVEHLNGAAPRQEKYLHGFEDKHKVRGLGPENIQAYLEKMATFERSHIEDIHLEYYNFPPLVTSFKRLERVQRLVGHGNFNVLGFDEMIRFSKRYESVGAFTKSELNLLESLFAADATRYGFYGAKVIDQLTSVVKEKDRVKIGNTGHYLFKGQPQEVFRKLSKDVGINVELTSGIRGVVKQTFLFLAKTVQAKGNLSLASRSLAPPGHSFHGIGDFDVGKRGFGARNFTADFTQTDEFKRLVELGYISMRYPEKNLLGVRYEPWHIKVV